MFIIGRQQYDALCGQAERDFNTRMSAFIDEYFAHLTSVSSGENRSAWVTEAIQICDRYEIATEREAAQLILLLLVLGIEADSQVWVREILDDADLVSEGKLRKLVRAARERDMKHLNEVVLFDDLEG